MIFSCYAGALMPRDDPDMNGVSHTVEITAAPFYEAVAPCLAATNRLPEFPRGSNAVKVVGSRMFVSSMRSRPWISRSLSKKTNGSPREVSDRLNSINSQPPLLYPATTIKAKSCGPDSGREEVRSQRVPLWESHRRLETGRCGKIEPDAKDKIYYDARDLQNLLANHGEKMEITSRTLQAMVSQVHGYGDTFWPASAGKARIPLASMMRK